MVITDSEFKILEQEKEEIIIPLDKLKINLSRTGLISYSRIDIINEDNDTVKNIKFSNDFVAGDMWKYLRYVTYPNELFVCEELKGVNPDEDELEILYNKVNREWIGKTYDKISNIARDIICDSSYQWIERHRIRYIKSNFKDKKPFLVVLKNKGRLPFIIKRTDNAITNFINHDDFVLATTDFHELEVWITYLLYMKEYKERKILKII